MRGYLSPGTIVLFLTVVLGGGFMASGAGAAGLVIGQAHPILSADPHFADLPGNNALALHVFETLVRVDANQRLLPGLAKSWRAVSATEWEFQLRQGVVFQDGGAFTAEDVVFSINRASRVPVSPAPFTRYVAGIGGAEAINPQTLRIRTERPLPLLPYDLSRVFILSRTAAGGKTSEELDQAANVVGTGPFRFLRWEEGRRAVLAGNKTYWNGPQPWEQVVLQAIPDDEARARALREGRVQLIEGLSPETYAALGKAKGFKVYRGLSGRLLVLQLDNQREDSPYVSGARKNPLLEQPVRRAISLAIDRAWLAKRGMGGLAYPAGQLVPDGFFGRDPGRRPDPHDLRRARGLLARAGYPRGFGLTVHAPSDSGLEDGKIARAVAAMLGKAGIRAQADVMPRAVFFPRAARQQLSAMLVPWGAGTGEASEPLKALLATRDGHGWGTANWGRYSNPRLDRLVAQALASVDDTRRERLLREAQQIGLKDYGVIPLFFQANTWAAAKGITFSPRMDGMTLAMQARPAR